MRLLLGGVLTVVAIVSITLAITVMAPYIAILCVVVVIWKLSKDELNDDDEGPRKT
jgi:hypothetical protein